MINNIEDYVRQNCKVPFNFLNITVSRNIQPINIAGNFEVVEYVGINATADVVIDIGHNNPLTSFNNELQRYMRSYHSDSKTNYTCTCVFKIPLGAETEEQKYHREFDSEMKKILSTKEV